MSSLCTRHKLSSRKLEERGVIRVVPNKVLGPCESGVVEEDIDGVHGMRGAMPWVASRRGCLKPTWWRAMRDAVVKVNGRESSNTLAGLGLELMISCGNRCLTS